MKIEKYTIIFSIPDNTSDEEFDKLFWKLKGLIIADEVRMYIQKALDFYDLNVIEISLTEESDLET